MDIIKDCTNRLVSCGFSHAEALRTVKDFMKNYYGSKQLVEFVEEKEKENVDKVQCQSGCKQCGGLCHSCGCGCSKH